MKLRFVYPKFARHADHHPELREAVPCNEYFGPPSLGIACLAAVTPSHWEYDFRDERVEDIGMDDDVDLIALSFFTPAATRGLELADAYRAQGKKVVMGGIFPTLMPEIAAEHADAIVVGEGEGVWADVLRDVEQGTLKPRYSGSSVDPSSLPLPKVELYLEKENDVYRPDDYPVQIARGCPLKCFACVLPASMGPKLRHFGTEHALGQIDQLAKHGKLGSLTEDTSLFFGSGTQRRFGWILDAIAERGGPAPFSYLGTSMPMIRATSSDFLGRMRRAGINMFYLVGGFDPFTMKAFTGQNPDALQNAFDAVQKCYDHGIEPYTSFLVGNDQDDEGTFDRMLEFANKAKIRKAEFAVATPYPGTAIWHRLVAEDRIIDRTWAHYNDANVVFQPKNMSPDRLLQGYLYMWKEFYKSRQELKNLGREERTIQF
ncbi:MAG: cobalamin-dependent protein [Polyangiaceae bacterium]